MWRCDPPTRLVVAIVAGLVAAAFGHPLVSRWSWRCRGARAALLMAVALAAALWGGMRVAALDHRSLMPGRIDGGRRRDRRSQRRPCVARVRAGQEDVLLQAPGYRPHLGGIYRAIGRLRADRRRGTRLLRQPGGAPRAARVATGVAVRPRWRDGACRRSARRRAAPSGRGGDPPADRSLVAGVTLGETGSAAGRRARRSSATSGLYHLVAVSAAERGAGRDLRARLPGAAGRDRRAGPGGRGRDHGRATCSSQVRGPRSCGRVWRARWWRWPGWHRGRPRAGTCWPAARRWCWR